MHLPLGQLEPELNPMKNYIIQLIPRGSTFYFPFVYLFIPFDIVIL